MNQDASPIEIEVIAEEIIRGVLRVTDPVLRVTVAGDKLIAREDGELVDILLTIHRLSYLGHDGAREFWPILLDPDALVNRLDPFRKSRIYHRAAKSGLGEIIALFSPGRAARKSKGDGQDFQVYGAAELTLGERLALARKTDRKARAKAAYDINPRVTDTLLSNPRTTESDVMKIASRRPNDAAILQAIFQNKKWISRYQVKIAIARNPYTPSNIATNLLPQITLKDLVEVRDDRSLHMNVRQAAMALILHRRKRAESASTSE